MMENYFGAKTTRSGVVVDLDPPLGSRAVSQRPTNQERSMETQDSGIIQNGSYEGMNSLTLMDAPIPNSMFMQAVNFETFKTQQALQNNSGLNTAEGQLDRSLETSMDILEHQQAIEQARLLQRFKELRQMQLQQQELLMQQQKNQLDTLKEEQKQVQMLIAKQRQNKWGGKPNSSIAGPSNCRTPPLRKNPTASSNNPAVSLNNGTAKQDNHLPPAVQSTSNLPRPVIYVPLDDENDEIKTNPDLFSDTNSYVGSLATTEEGIYPVPESASEASGDVYRAPENKQKPLKCPRLKLLKHHREITKDHGSEFHDISKIIDLEQDEGIGTQSLRSSGHTDQQSPTSHQKREVDDESDDDESNKHHDEDDDDFEEQLLDDEDFTDDEDDHEDDDDDDDDDQQDTTCIDTGAVKNELNLRPEDRPISGIAGKKTFEELLEEQLRAEEDKMKVSESPVTNGSPKRVFLKKGEGLSRFGIKGDKPIKTVINKANIKSTLPEGAIVTNKQEKKSKTKDQQKPEKKTTKTSPKPTQTNNKKSPQSSKSPRGQVQTTLKLNANQKSKGKEESSKQHNQQKEDGLKKRSQQKSAAGKESTATQHSKETGKKMTEIASSRPKVEQDPVPDDASFIDKIEQRERNKEFEQEDLEEFEMLEDFADNVSFCSNSSVVQRVLERDRIRQHLGRLPQSPRCSVAKQIELASKKEEFKRKFERVAPVLPKEPSKEITKTTAHEIKENENHSNNVNESDSDKLSDSSEEESSESDESSSELSEDSDEEEVKSESQKNKHVTNESDNLRTRLKHKDSDSSSSDEESDNVVKSPSKIMTRKIASKDDRTTLNTVSNLLQKLNSGNSRLTDSHNDSLNSSSFVPQVNSPIIISRDVVTSKGGAKNLSVPEDEDSDFKLHSQFSSHPKHSSPVHVLDDKSDSEMSDTSSYRALNISAKSSKANISKGATQNSSAQVKNNDLDFDDEEEWGDTTLKDKVNKTDSDSEDTTEKFNSRDTKGSNIDTDGTPPTSKLVTKLFPKLKPQPTKQQIQERQQLQVANSASVGDGIQSKLLREKLAELEKEIEKFRNENAALDRQRKERDEGLSKLKKEIEAFEKEKNEELNRIQEYKNEEMKKLRHEKKMFEKYQKASRNMPDKKEREEIEMLKNQLSELQEEMKRKESRWTSSNSRLRSKLEQLEQENSELKEEIKLMEKKRLEWLAKEQGKTKSQPVQKNHSTEFSSNAMQKSSADFQTTDSDEEKDPVKDLSGSRSSHPASTSQSNMKLNQARPEVSVRGQIPNNLSAGQHQHARSSQSSGHNIQATTHQKHPPNRAAPPNATTHKPNTTTWLSSNPVTGVVNHGGNQTAPGVRMSLMEDTPRQEPNVIAMPQDTSMYSEADAAEVLGNNNLPRKRASKFSVDKSAIDKGSSGYEEVQHNDGKVERIYSTGAREILFSNGTRKEISADGQSIVVSFFNGDIKQIMPDQTVKYYYAETQTTHSTYPDGLEILQFPNNQVEKHYPDGTKEIIFPDQTIKYLFPNGSEESIFPDGTVIRVDKTGDKTMEFPNGQREIHTQEYKRREYPDGTVKTVYPDGRQETRYSNGRIRVKDRDGNVIIDRRC